MVKFHIRWRGGRIAKMIGRGGLKVEHTRIIDDYLLINFKNYINYSLIYMVRIKKIKINNIKISQKYFNYIYNILKTSTTYQKCNFF